MRRISEAEKAVIVFLVVVGGAALWTLGERLVFLAGSERGVAEVVGTSAGEVRVAGTVDRPQGNRFATTQVAVSFEAEDGRFHWSPDMAYFFAAPEPGAQVAIRYDPSAPEQDVRRAGVDLFGVPLLFALLALPIELLRRYTARSAQASAKSEGAKGGSA